MSNRGEIEAWVTKELDRYRERWKQGSFDDLRLAFQLAAANEVSIPPWLRDAIDAALLQAFIHGGADGRGKSGGYLVRQRRRAIHLRRHAVVRRLLLAKIDPRLPPTAISSWRPHSKDDAFAKAAAELAGTFAQGSKEAVAISYRRIERELD